ncbi:MAG: undecaprenyldiphospho-muramoylpentapeptide beta-N-acetylglucosaminyltransferase [Deltaproteobacteria bacterium]|nr:undecaprenyldiphospho-muramoylpentapeptide beta-N-acetylglucosaminyltransferase [Deltaproteobacteria bacterium]
MRLIMAGGGTGGHLFPGLAVAREFRRRDRMTEILFVGTELGIESRILPREGFPLATIPIRGLKGRGLRGSLQALYGIPVSFFRSLGIIARFRPDCIIGLGGYASGPFLLAGKSKGIRCAIMEQNLRPGFTNRILSCLADRVFTSYEESAPYFPRARVITAGNPVRWQALPEIAKSEKFTLLVFGGSAGAHKINLCVIEALQSLRDLTTGLRVMHQTGQADFAAIKEAYGSLPFEADVLPFVERMDEAYARADLVLCRAGAGTVSELTVFGKAAILVPYPYAAYDHQRFHAQVLQDQGAAEMILDRELTGEKLAERIRALYLDRKRLEAIGMAARKLGKPEAAKRIVDECYALLKAEGGRREA